MRHHGEAPSHEAVFETALEEAMMEEPIPIASDENKPSSRMSNLSKLAKLPKMSTQKEKKQDETGVVSKFWNWATQLF